MACAVVVVVVLVVGEMGKEQYAGEEIGEVGDKTGKEVDHPAQPLHTVHVGVEMLLLLPPQMHLQMHLQPDHVVDGVAQDGIELGIELSIKFGIKLSIKLDSELFGGLLSC